MSRSLKLSTVSALASVLILSAIEAGDDGQREPVKKAKIMSEEEDEQQNLDYTVRNDLTE